MSNKIRPTKKQVSLILLELFLGVCLILGIIMTVDITSDPFKGWVIILVSLVGMVYLPYKAFRKDKDGEETE